MAERRVFRVRLLMAGLALVVAGLAVALLVQSWRDRDDARHDLAAARVALADERSISSASGAELRSAHRIIATIEDQLPAVPPAATAIAKFDAQDLDAVRAAVQAGLAGDLGAYNQSVDQRDVVDPQHDVALEQLRKQANAIITALDQVRG